MRRLRLPAALLAIGLASIGVGLAPPRAAAADEVSFGKPDAVADYGTAITFTVDVTRSVPLERAELRLRLPDTIGPLIVDVPVPPGTGTTQLQYVLDVTGGGHIVPNTPITRDVGRVHRSRRRPGRQPRRSRAVPGHDPRLAQGQGRPDDRPLVRRRGRLRQQGAPDRREGHQRHGGVARRDRDRARRLLHLRGPGLVPGRPRPRDARERRAARRTPTSGRCSR